MTTEASRFDVWPAKIPKVGQIVQVHIANDDIIEAAVAGRRRLGQGIFQIWLDWPWTDGVLILDIVPDASAQDRADSIADLKPWWRIVPHTPSPTSAERRGVKVFFLDE